MLARVQIQEKALRADFEARQKLLRAQRELLTVKLRLAMLDPALPVKDNGTLELVRGSGDNAAKDVTLKVVDMRIPRLRRCRALLFDGTIHVIPPGPTSYLAADVERVRAVRPCASIAAAYRVASEAKIAA